MSLASKNDSSSFLVIQERSVCSKSGGNSFSEAGDIPSPKFPIVGFYFERGRFLMIIEMLFFLDQMDQIRFKIARRSI